MYLSRIQQLGFNRHSSWGCNPVTLSGTLFQRIAHNQLTGIHQCGQFVNLPQSTCPNRSNIFTKRINAQLGCVTNVDSYSVYACTYVASVRDISMIVCYHQVLFVAVTKLLRFLERKKLIFVLLQVFTQKIHV